MNVQPHVSIALATYNGERFIAKQMDSLLAQDYPNLEIVISDDCSTDGTWSILQAYAERDSRIRLLPRDANRGYVENFVRVFMSCKNDLISPCDQDDIWHPNKTRRLVESIDDHSLVYCNSRFIDENGIPLGKTLADTIGMISGKDPRNLLFCTSICGHAMLFRKDLVQATNHLGTAPYIDWIIAFLAAHKNGISYLNEVLVDWRQHQASTSAHVRSKAQGSRSKTIETDEKIIHIFSSLPGKYQDFALQAEKKWTKWHDSYFNLSMFFFVLRYGHITHIAHTARHPSLKYLAGYKIKKLLRPSYY